MCMVRPLLLAALTGLIGLSACSETRFERPARSVLEDSQVVSTDTITPYADFSGQSGSLLLGEGWGRREGDGQPSDWGSFSWVIGQEAAIHFPLDRTERMDFFARAIAFPNNIFFDTYQTRLPRNHRPQTVTVLIDGQEVATSRIQRDWASFRVPLPEGKLKKGFQRLVLRFADAIQPNAVSNAPDGRRLAAAFSLIAIVPRELSRPGEALKEQTAASEANRIRIGKTRTWDLPLPKGARAELKLGSVVGDCSGCTLSIDLAVSPNTRRLLWEGKPREAGGLTLTFEIPHDRTTLLRMRLVNPAGASSAWEDQFVRVERPNDFLKLRYPDTPNNAAKPSVFLYMVDTLRADALSPYGGDPAVTPRLTEFAQDAVTYETARAPSSWTLPSIASLLTGTYAFRHKAMRGDVKFSEGRTPSLARILGEHGYTSVAVSQSVIASARFGFGDSFDDFFLNDHLNSYGLRSQRIRRFLIQWLLDRGTDDRPFMAYVHTVGPHAPYAPYGEFRRFAEEHPGSLSREEYLPAKFMAKGHGRDAQELAHLRALYQGEVMYSDENFGKFIELLKYLGLYEDSVIIFVSDHGEEFGEHGGFDHGRTLYEELLRVPLMVKFPGSRWAGERVDLPVSLVDVVPMILDYLDLPSSGLTVDGQPVPPVASSEDLLASRIGLAELVNRGPAEHKGPVSYRAFIQGAQKCIQSLSGKDQFQQTIPEWQAFDLSVDPGEQDPLDGRSAASACEPMLQRWGETIANRGSAKGEQERTSPESLEKLRSLGYIQ